MTRMLYYNTQDLVTFPGDPSVDALVTEEQIRSIRDLKKDRLSDLLNHASGLLLKVLEQFTHQVLPESGGDVGDVAVEYWVELVEAGKAHVTNYLHTELAGTSNPDMSEARGCHHFWSSSHPALYVPNRNITVPKTFDTTEENGLLEQYLRTQYGINKDTLPHFPERQWVRTALDQVHASQIVQHDTFRLAIRTSEPYRTY